MTPSSHKMKSPTIPGGSRGLHSRRWVSSHPLREGGRKTGASFPLAGSPSKTFAFQFLPDGTEIRGRESFGLYAYIAENSVDGDCKKGDGLG